MKLKREKPVEALLIIDMQAGSFQTAQRFDAAGVIRRINRLSEHFRSKGAPVIFIQHDGTKENYLLPGTPDFDLVHGLVRDPEDITVVKIANDAFYRTELDICLKDLGVTQQQTAPCWKHERSSNSTTGSGKTSHRQGAR